MCPGPTMYLPELGIWPASPRETLPAPFLSCQLWVCPDQCGPREDIFFFYLLGKFLYGMAHDYGEKFPQGIRCRMNVPLETETPSVPLFAFTEFPTYPLSKSR